jgi:hypothetical protein
MSEIGLLIVGLCIGVTVLALVVLYAMENDEDD